MKATTRNKVKSTMAYATSMAEYKPLLRSKRMVAILEVTAAAGLALNALIYSDMSPLSGAYLLIASYYLIGIGVLGMSVMRASHMSKDANRNRRSSAVYGGIILVTVVPGVFGSLTAFYGFNNLLGVLLTLSTGVGYMLLWNANRM